MMQHNKFEGSRMNYRPVQPGELSDEQLREILVAGGRPPATAAALIQAANRAGGRDNITAVVVDVLAGGDAGGEGRADTRESHDWTEDGDTVPV